MLNRTPSLAILISGIISIITVIIFETPSRPFTISQGILLYLVAFPPSLGIAMLFDPIPRKAKEDFLKINFYEEKQH